MKRYESKYSRRQLANEKHEYEPNKHDCHVVAKRFVGEIFIPIRQWGARAYARPVVVVGGIGYTRLDGGQIGRGQVGLFAVTKYAKQLGRLAELAEIAAGRRRFDERFAVVVETYLPVPPVGAYDVEDEKAVEYDYSHDGYYAHERRVDEQMIYVNEVLVAAERG